VDDEDALLEFEREVLSGAGATVAAVTSGEAAIEKLRRESFDVIVIDGKMPGNWSATEIHAWLKENRPEMANRIVLALSDSSEERIRRFIQSNSIPCLVKPFEVADLLSTVRRAASESAKRAGA
jgi:CheY-like chemotaxis protein